jgi:hypothetical protein
MYFISAVTVGVLNGEDLPNSTPVWLRVQAIRDYIHPTPFNSPLGMSSNSTGTNVDININANAEYKPPTASPPTHITGGSDLRSRFQTSLLAASPHARPLPSLIDRNNEQPHITLGRRPSVNASANNSDTGIDFYSASALASRPVSHLDHNLPFLQIENATASTAAGINHPGNMNRNPNANSEELVFDDIFIDASPEAETLPPYTEVAPNLLML